MRTRSGLGSMLSATADKAMDKDVYTSGPPKRRKKKFKPKGVNKPHSRRKRRKICVGGRCGA